MKKSAREAKKVDELRTRAEKLLKSKKNVQKKSSGADSRTLVHELQVHQVELEMQNEELRRTQQELEASREKYYDLYDLAPVGYFSLDQKNLILEVNLKGAGLLGIERRLLIKKRFTQFIVPAFQDSFYMFQNEALKTKAVQTLELQLKKKSSAPCWARLEAQATQGIDGSFTHMRIVAIDISDKKLSQEDLKKSRDELEERVEERTVNLQRANEQLESLSSQLLKVQEKERKRIAQELHDSIGQTLSALKFNIEHIINQLGEKPEGVGCSLQLNSLIPKLQETIVEVNRIGRGLRPSMLDDFGVLAALSWFCREFQSVYSAIQIEKLIDVQEDHVPDDLKIVVYRVLQEGLNNVAKHSGASQVMISLRKTSQAIEFSIMDNGCGFEVESVLSRKRERMELGVLGMIKRIELSGGFCKISSDREEGTTIMAVWPL